MKMLGSREGMGSPAGTEASTAAACRRRQGPVPALHAPAPAKKTPSFEDMDDDIPF
jgi:single-stranded DNA-binding protein